jgi:hypothetical protein
MFPSIALVAAFRSPQVPSHSLPFPLDKDTKDTPERSRSVSTNRYSRPIGRRSQCAANGTRSNWATITFLGEQLDIIDPEAAVPAAGQRRKANAPSARSRLTSWRETLRPSQEPRFVNLPHAAHPKLLPFSATTCPRCGIWRLFAPSSRVLQDQIETNGGFGPIWELALIACRTSRKPVPSQYP